MSELPLFSVLIANYNNGKYLQEAIDSVLAQTYTNWEIIIVDDSSTDNSNELYKQLGSDSRIHIYNNEENKGCGFTKRRCAELANGEICGFLDPDDTLSLDALEVMVTAHSSNRNVSLVYSRHNEMDANMNFLKVSIQQTAMPIGGSFLYGDGGISAFASFKKNLYKKTSGINPDFQRAIDHDLYYKLEEVGDVLFIDKVLYNYRLFTGNNISVGDNSNKAFLWHIISEVDACRRRQLPIEDVIYRDFNSFISWHRTEAREEGRRLAQMTKSYRIGKFILSPLRKFNQLFERKK